MSDSEFTQNEGHSLPAELSNISFQDLNKYTTQFSINRKKINSRKASESQLKRENKNRPREMSSKRPSKSVLPKSNVEEKPRDPRFDDRAGTFFQQDFQENYKFLNKVKKKEYKMLKLKLQDPVITPSERENIKLLLQRQENQIRDMTNKRKQMKLMNEKREFEINQLKQGKKPFYQKKSAQKLLQLAEQFEELKSKGALGKHMKRHRKKKMIKDRMKIDLAS